MPQERPYSSPVSLEAVAQRAKEYTQSNGGHPTTLILEGEHELITTLFEKMAPTHDERAFQLYMTGRLLAERKIIQVLQQIFLISEAWVRSIERGAPPSSADAVPRTEALIVSQMALPSRSTNVVIYEMKRTLKGRLTGLESLPNLGEQSLTAHSPLLEMVALGFLGYGQKPH